MEMNKRKKHQSMLLYALLAAAVIFALNSAFSSMRSGNAIQTSYSEFSTMLNNGSVTSVKLNTNSGELFYTASKDNKEQDFVTTQFPRNP